MFGERLKRLRTKKKMRQEDVAKNLGIARTTYAMYEQNSREPDFDILQKLADFFEVTTDYLLTGRTEPPKEAGQVDEISSEVKIFLDDFLSAPEEKKAEVMKYWHRIVKDTADNDGEPKESAWERARRNKRK